MAVHEKFLEHVLKLLDEVDGITYEEEDGYYNIYKNGVEVAGIYDRRFMVKRTMGNFKRELPQMMNYYPGGTAMFLIESNDPWEVKKIIETAYKDLMIN